MPRTTADSTSPVLDFARDFIGGIASHRDIRTELLAEAFRTWCGLGPFPTLTEIAGACCERGIPLQSLPSSAPMKGLNVWAADGAPRIHLRDDLPTRLAETTLGHELREMLENAFQRVSPAYVGLDTADNRTMNRESDQFAGCLLLQAEASRRRLIEAGFDFLRFAHELGRSLPSVIVRARELFSAQQRPVELVGAVWLFEAPWEDVIAGRATAEDMWVTLEAKFGGFTAAKAARGGGNVARHVFPAKEAKAESFSLVCGAASTGYPASRRVGGFDLFGERDFLVVAEPIIARGCPWRVVLSAARSDYAGAIRPWLARVGQPVAESFQSL